METFNFEKLIGWKKSIEFFDLIMTKTEDLRLLKGEAMELTKILNALITSIKAQKLIGFRSRFLTTI